MKRNFLLMLLLTLLPLAGWAQSNDPEPGGDPVPSEPSVIVVNPVLTGLIEGTTNAWLIGSDLPGVQGTDYAVEGYYDSEGFPVSVITEVGWYFVKVESSLEGVNPTYVPFQAWKKISTEFINNAASFNQSVISGALQLYYEEWGTEGNVPEQDYDGDKPSWAKAARPTDTKYTSGVGAGFPWIVFKSTESVPCRVSFVYDEGDPVYPWASFHNNNIFFSTTGKKYGVASINEELHKGQVWYDPTDEHADAEGNVENYKSNWVDSKFTAYFTPAATEPQEPASFKTIDHVYNVMVSGVNGQTKAYGAELELSVSLITTNKDEINGDPAFMNAIMNKLELVYDLKYEPVGNDKYYYIRLKEGVIPTIVNEVGGGYVYTYGTDYVDVPAESGDEIDRYIIKPTGSGTIEITAATDNAFEAPMGTVYNDLVYNGKEQILINEPAKAKYGDVVYYASNEEVTNFDAVNAAWVASTEIKGKNAGNYYVYAKVEATANYNGIEPTLLYAPTTVDNVPSLLAPGPAVIAPFDLADVTDADKAATYKPTGNTWSYDGTAHNIAVEPAAKSDMTDLTVLYATAVNAEDADWKAVDNFKATKNADNKKVFWKIVGNDNIAAVAPAETQFVEATITPAQVTLALENGKTKIALDPTKYWYKGGAEIAIGTPSGVTYTPNNLGGTLKYYVEKKDGNIYNPVNENKVKEIGNYRYNAKFVGNDDVADAGPMPDAQCATFEVVQPTVAISTTVTPGVVGVGAVPTCGWTAKWDDADHLDQIVAPANVTYTYYRKNRWGQWQQVQPSTFQAGQTIQVRVNWNNFTTKKGTDAGYTTVAEGTWATFTVAGSQIEAEIEPGTFAYGQVLPLTIKYVSGFGEGEDAADNIEAFNEASRSGFMKAKMIKDAEGNDLTDGEVYTLTSWTERHWNRNYTFTTALPVGTYKVSANFENDNQLIITKTAEWTIVPKDITNADVTYDADGKTSEFEVYGIGTSKIDGDEFNFTKTYIGAQIVPTMDDFRGIYFSYAFDQLTAEDFEIVGPTNKNANINAGEGIFKVVGKGNFTGEKELTFTIAKKEVTARPKPATWAIGSDPAYEVDYEDLYTQLEGKDLKDEDGDSEFDIYTADGFKDIKVRRLAEVTVGTYSKGIEAYLPADATPAQNYDIKPGTAALTIEKGKITLKLKNVEAVYNGKDVPVIAYDFEPIMEGKNASTLSEVMLDNDNWKTVIGTPEIKAWTETGGWNLKFKLDPTEEGDDGRYVAGKTYTIQYDENQTALLGGKKNKELMTSTNYEVTVDPEFTEATVTITKAPITVTVLDQEGVDVDHVKTDLVLLTEETGFNATIKAEPGLKAGDNLSMLFGTNKITVEGNRVLNLEKNQTGFGLNYDVTVVPGNLNVEAYERLKLLSDGTDAATIAAKDNKPYKYIEVVIKPSRMKVNGENNYFDWKEDKWHAMVLPFAASVSQISRAFSFAIVNVVDLDNTKEDHIAFMLPSATATVPANTPFMLKTSKDININGKEYTATFSPKDEDELEEGEVNFYTIEAPKAENTYELPQTDKDPVSQVFIDADDLNLGYKFAGTYDQIIIDKNLSYLRFLNDNNVWSKVGSASTAKFYMAPYAGYINRGEANGTREFIVTFEEEDGSTTAIKDINFEGGNKVSAEGLYRVDGIKVQGATTQKGVYIQDGKKFVK